MLIIRLYVGTHQLLPKLHSNHRQKSSTVGEPWVLEQTTCLLFYYGKCLYSLLAKIERVILEALKGKTATVLPFFYFQNTGNLF